MLSKSTSNLMRVLVDAVLATVALAFMAVALAAASQAQAPIDKTAKPQATLSDPATREAVRELISELDDKQVRSLLVERLSKEVDQRAAKHADGEADAIGEVVKHYVHALGRYVSDAVSKLPRIPGGVSKAWSNFMDERGERSVVWFFLSVLACLLIGGAAAFGAQRAAARLENGVKNAIEVENFVAEETHDVFTLLGPKASCAPMCL